MLRRLFRKKDTQKPQFITAQLNARLQPMHRGEFFEDPLAEELEIAGLGEISGGGTMVSEQGEPMFCDIEVDAKDASPRTVQFLIDQLERLGAPKGSKLIIASIDRAMEFGVTEGLAVYLNGAELPPQTYKECDSNFVRAEFERLVNGAGRVLSSWQGPRETAFYLYGKSFTVMKSRLEGFIQEYPLCRQCRVERVA